MIISAPLFNGNLAEGAVFSCNVDNRNECLKLNVEIEDQVDSGKLNIVLVNKILLMFMHQQNTF